MIYFSVVDYCVVLLLVLSSLAIGLYFAWKDKNKSNDEYLTGGRAMGVLPVLMSLMASYLTAYNFIGWPVEIYTRGTQLFMSVVADVVSTLVAANIFIPIYFKLRTISVNTYLLERFNSPTLVVIASLLMTVSWLPGLGIVLYSPSLALGVASGLSTSTCILLTAAVVTIYTTFGGVKAVIWTDVLQLLLMMAGLFAIVIKGTYEVGNIGEVLGRNNGGGRIELFNFELNPYMPNNLLTIVLGTSFFYTAMYSSDQLAVQRTCTLPNIDKAKKALYYVLFGFILINVLVLYLGMVIYAYYYKCDPLKTGQIKRIDEIVTLFVSEMFGNSYPGLLGLFVACILSSSLSTLSSGYTALAALIWEDWLKRLLPDIKPATALKITKLLSVIVSGIAVAFAFLAMNVGTLFEAIFTLIGSPVGPLFGIYFMGVACPNVNAKGVISGLVTGFVLSVWITAGSLLNEVKVPMILPTATDDCDISLYPNITNNVAFETLKYARIPEYEPKGWNLLYHISPLFRPVVSFVVAVVVGNIVSLLTGNNSGRVIDSNLLCDFVNKFRGVEKKMKDDIPIDVLKHVINTDQTKL